MAETTPLVRFGLWNHRSLTHIGTVQPPPEYAREWPGGCRSGDTWALFVPLCGRMRPVIWDRDELERGTRLGVKPCPACESKAAALRGQEAEDG
jgi:hypothetical protein